VLSSVKEANEKLQRDKERSVKGEISKLKEEVRLENKRLIEQFESKNIRLSKCFDNKLLHESAKMSKLVQQVRDDNERELVAAKKNIQVVSKELHDKIESHVLKATELASDLGNQMTLQKENADKQVSDMMKEANKNVQTEMTNSAQTWQKETGEKVQNLNIEFEKLESINRGNFEQLNSELNAIKLKLFDCTTVGCSPTTLPPNDNVSINPGRSSSESADNVNPNTTTENVRITHRVPCDCNECLHANVSDQRGMLVSNNVSPHAPGSCFNPTELSLPYFYDSSKINAMCHLKQLDEYFTLKGVPRELQLAIALRSITDPTAKDWVSAVSHTLNDYSHFKSAFAIVYWN
jgi:hypothetical protein